MDTKKLGKSTDQRNAMLRGLVTDLLWNGKIETTFDRAKAAASRATDGKPGARVFRHCQRTIQRRQSLLFGTDRRTGIPLGCKG